MQHVSSVPAKSARKKPMPVGSLILFLRQLSVLADGTLPFDEALGIIGQSGANRQVRTAGEELGRRTREGALLSDAMRDSGSFSPILLAMVRTGEESGSLGPVLSNYTGSLERQEQTRRRIQQALIYPLLLSVVSIVVVTFLLLYVIPSFVELFAGAGVHLPLPTRILLSVSEASSAVFPWVSGAAGLLLLLALFAFRREKGRLLLHGVLMRVPFFGTLFRDLRTVRMAELMALFFEGNVDLVQFLEILSAGTGSVSERHALTQIHRRILEGETVSSAFAAAGYYNPVFTGMLRIGEESGRLSEVTRSIAEYLDLEIQLRLGRAVALLEPALILTLSLLVGFIVLAVAMPMFQMVHLYDF